MVFDQLFKNLTLYPFAGPIHNDQRQESGRARVKESEKIAGFNQQAERLIEQKAMLLLTQRVHIEKWTAGRKK
jgi:hypothetical protein